MLSVTSRTPYYDLPITMIQKAMKQKVYRQMHCIECGMPFAEITDKVVAIIEHGTPIIELIPNSIGIVAMHCPRKVCQQRFRFEFAL